LACSQRRERKGRGREQGGFSAACGGGRRARGRRKEGGKGEADRWDPSVGAAVKKKRGGESGGLARGVGLGRLGRKDPVLAFCFFSFLSFLKLHFQIIFQLKFKSNFFKLFSRI
jgi:hypothetical protein